MKIHWYILCQIEQNVILHASNTTFTLYIEYKCLVSGLQDEPWCVTEVKQEIKDEVTTEELQLLPQG
jgi:hypothetical protein